MSNAINKLETKYRAAANFGLEYLRAPWDRRVDIQIPTEFNPVVVDPVIGDFISLTVGDEKVEVVVVRRESSYPDPVTRTRSVDLISVAVVKQRVRFVL